jgi:hypothetical protein
MKPNCLAIYSFPGEKRKVSQKDTKIVKLKAIKEATSPDKSYCSTGKLP